MEQGNSLKVETGMGDPCLYLHGLGALKPVDSVVADAVAQLGFEVWGQHRDDLDLFSQSNPVEQLHEQVCDAVVSVSEQTGKRLVLFGNSLGSYLALRCLYRVGAHVKGVIGVDAFLDPAFGFTLPKTTQRRVEVSAQIARSFDCIEDLLPDEGVDIPQHFFFCSEDGFDSVEHLEKLKSRWGSFDYTLMKGLGHNEWTGQKGLEYQAQILECLADMRDAA